MNLHDYIDQNGTNVAQLARSAGVDAKTIWRHLKDGSELRVSTAKKIARATNQEVTVYDLIDVTPLVINPLEYTLGSAKRRWFQLSDRTRRAVIAEVRDLALVEGDEEFAHAMTCSMTVLLEGSSMAWSLLLGEERDSIMDTLKNHWPKAGSNKVRMAALRLLRASGREVI